MLSLLLAVTLASVAPPPGAEPRTLVAEADLDGDGELEIVWKVMTHGAHTEHAWVYVTSGAPDHRLLPGSPVRISTPQAVTVQGHDLVLKGGLVTSAGAGQAQRTRTDTYRWDGEKIALVDRRFAPSEMGYHRLQDGIVAEQFGQVLRAVEAYLAAMDPARQALAPEVAAPDGKAHPQLDEAVRSFARLRLGLLLWPSADPAAACRAAAAWAEQNPTLLEALNSPYGYANPRWEPQTLCGPLPETG